MADKSTRPQLLLTRPAAGSERFHAALTARGMPVGDAVISPAMEVVPVGAVVRVPPGAAVIFTSQHAVTRATAAPGTDAFCVGAATTKLARQAAYNAISADGSADALIDTVLAHAPDADLIHLHGTHVRGEVAGTLRAAGHRVSEHVVYDQPELKPNPAAKALLAGASPIILPLFSPRSAAIVANWTQGAVAPLQAVALSDAVAKNWPDDAMVAHRPDLEAMVDAVVELYARQGNG